MPVRSLRDLLFVNYVGASKEESYFQHLEDTVEKVFREKEKFADSLDASLKSALKVF